jgi:hypothetical protein
MSIDSGLWFLVFWSLVTCYWSLVSGHWLLVAGRSMLAAGWWFLEISGIECLKQSA